MLKFKGFDDWIPIFQGGSQTDSAGRVHDGTALIEKAVTSFDAAKHEPPVVIGHPADNAPAWGWVEGLKKQGDLLLAKFKQVVPAFADMVKQGLFKKRSAAFYPDGTLRHVAFLGAGPPAVKGLPDLKFTDKASATFEFNDNPQSQKEGNMKFSEFLEIFKFWKQVEKDPDVDLLAAGIQHPATSIQRPASSFTEADIEAAKKEAAAAAAKAEREKLTAEFAEKDRTAKREARRQEISSWCEAKVKEGKMTPAMVKYGVPEFMAAFADKDDIIEFGDLKEKATLYDRFKGFFETELPKVIEFKEIASRDKDTGGAGNAGAKLTGLVKTKMDSNKELTYSAAFTEVQRENPDLAREYAAEYQEVK